MKKIFYFSCILLFHLNVSAQNIVSNGSFEQHNSFYQILDTIEGNYPGVKDWWSANHMGSPDFFSKLSPYSNSQTPKNFWTYQNPKTGNNYLGFGSYYGDENNTREYIETRLSTPMKSGSTYFLKFYVSLYDSIYPWGFYFSYQKITAINCLGAYISNVKLDTAGVSVIRRTPQIKATTFLTDTAGWMEISGYYTAHGGEQYLTIGNFYDDAHTPLQTVLNTPGGIAASYYIIDDVSVEDASGIFQLANSKEQLIITPNPATSNIQIEIKNSNVELGNGTITIYNNIGQIVKNEDIVFGQNKSLIDISQLKNGNYHVKVQTSTQVLQTKLIVVR